VNCLSWTPDGDNLAFGGNDGMVRILDPVSRKEVKSYCWEVGNVNCLAFSQGMIAATGGADGLVLWDLL
jgi:WD40 repeat protein